MAVVTPYSEEKRKNAQQQASTGFTYDPFQTSLQTQNADKNRQNLQTQKPEDFTYQKYTPSATLLQAQSLLQQQLANKPGAYQSQWQTQMNETMDQILNRDKFSYDLNADALYQQYKDQYVLQGQQAMMDTMGQAQAMTGGYGNSYAQTVGQQTYQGYLQQLNARVPDLYQLALDQYNREGEALYNQYGLFADRENQDYGRYRDQVSDFNTERDYLANAYYNEADRDYNRYIDAYSRAYGEHRDAVSDWQQQQARADENYFQLYDRDYNQYADDRGLSYEDYWNQLNMAYQQDRDKVSDQQWQAEFDEAKRQYDQQYALALAKASSGSGGDSGGGSGGDSDDGTGYDNGKMTTEQIKKMQQALGVTVDGKWGPETQAAAEKKWGVNGADIAWAQYQNSVYSPGPVEPPVIDYSTWDAGEWEGYFSSIRQSEGQAAAEEELSYFTKQGLIPKNMVNYATIGARGGQKGH